MLIKERKAKDDKNNINLWSNKYNTISIRLP
jgi:hypothetical protein